MREFLLGKSPDSYLQNKYLYMSICECIMLFSIFQGEKIKCFLEKNSILQKFGKYSYEIYLVHCIVLDKIVEFKLGFWKKNTLTILFSILLAYFMKLLTEKIRCLKKY